MAKKFKDYYDHEYLKLISEKISSVYPRFDHSSFIAQASPHLEGLEFHQRQDLICQELSHHLPDDLSATLEIFTKMLGPELVTDTGMFTQGWWLWPIGRFVQHHCLEQPEPSYEFIFELTKRFTGEFSIRPLVEFRTKEALEVMVQWSLNPNVHVRRLSSEGIRTRLPWANKQLAVLAYPELVTKILTNVKDAPEKFVQKSVGNVINDLYKDEPKLAQAITSQWEKENPTKNTKWIINHGRRNLNT
jgi:3-methyladenine DNA glycosylase AlkC